LPQRYASTWAARAVSASAADASRRTSKWTYTVVHDAHRDRIRIIPPRVGEFAALAAIFPLYR